MKLSTPLLSLLVNFLLGASWAITFLGAIILFNLFLHVGFIYAFFGFFIGTLPGLICVLVMEYFFMSYEKLKEIKKQTKLLEELVNK